MSVLESRRIVITRAPHQAAEFERLLLEKRAVPLIYPCIDIAPPQNPSLLDDALRNVANGAFDWLVLTSANTVQAIANHCIMLGLKLPMLKVVAVGPATAEAAWRLLGLEAIAIPETYTSEELAKTFRFAPGARILLPQSALADEILPQMLNLAGAKVITVEAYQTMIGSGGVNLPGLLESGDIDAVTFTSPSTVRNLLRRLEMEGGAVSLLNDVCIACIGAKTAAAAREHGFFTSVMPDDHTISGLVTALEHYFDSEVRSDVQNKRHAGSNF